MTQEELNLKICRILDSKKAEDITVLNVSHLTVVADYFVIATARSNTQVRSLAESLEDKLVEEGIEPRRVDGMREGRWIVFDYASTIVHIFNDETRMMYCLEQLWSDGTNVTKFKTED